VDLYLHPAFMHSWRTRQLNLIACEHFSTNVSYLGLSGGSNPGLEAGCLGWGGGER
jgi:hypothetical protein